MSEITKVLMNVSLRDEISIKPHNYPKRSEFVLTSKTLCVVTLKEPHMYIILVIK